MSGKKPFFIDEKVLLVHQIGCVTLNISFNDSMENILKTRDDVCICTREWAKCIHRKMNVADFQCYRYGEYTLNVNIMFFNVSYLSHWL